MSILRSLHPLKSVPSASMRMVVQRLPPVHRNLANFVNAISVVTMVILTIPAFRLTPSQGWLSEVVHILLFLMRMMR